MSKSFNPTVQTAGRGDLTTSSQKTEEGESLNSRPVCPTCGLWASQGYKIRSYLKNYKIAE